MGKKVVILSCASIDFSPVYGKDDDDDDDDDDKKVYPIG